MLLAQVLINGVLLGGIYAAVALGFSIIWGVLNLINLAHGSMVILGAYVTYYLVLSTGLDPFALAPAAGAALFVVGYLLQRYLINLVIDSSVFMTLVMSFGINLLLVNFSLYAFSADIRSVTLPYSGLGWQIGDLRLPYARVGAFGLALLLTALLYAFIENTRLGLAIKATSFDREAAQLTGIDVKRVYAITFGIGAGMAGAAGALITLVQPFAPVLGDAYTMKSFVVVVLGGLGSIPGVIVAGLLLGVVENLVTLTLDPGLSNALSFMLLVAVLVLRPRGLFGKAHYAAI